MLSLPTRLAGLIARTGAFVLLAATLTFAQTPASIRGRILDPSGAVVQGAKVTLRSGTASHTTVTGQDGIFRVEALEPGEWSVLAEATGFAPGGAAVDAAPGRLAFLELSLDVASLSESVQVLPGRIAGSPEMMSRIPGSVDVLDRRTLESAHVFTINEAMRKVPGVHARDEEGLGLRPNIGIRGTNPTRSSRILLLEDGVPLTYAPYGDNASYYHPPVERFESIEVLKGSGQIAYGPMTVGGVVNYITPLPPTRRSGSVQFTAGNRDYLNAHGSFGATTGRVGYLFDYMRKQGAGARDNVDTGVNDVNGKGLLTLTAAQTLTLRGNYYGEDSQSTYSGLREDEWRAAPRSNAFANDQFLIDRGGASATHLWAPRGNIALSTTAYASVFRRHWWRQSSNSAQRPNDAADPACGGMANLLTTCGNEGRLRLFTAGGIEPRLHVVHGLLGADAETDLGMRLHLETQDRLQKNGPTPTSRDGVIVEDNERNNSAFSAFVQQRLRFGALTVTPGLRLEHVGYERTNNLRAVTGTTNLTQLIPGLGIAHALSSRVVWFAGVHRGFAPPRTEDIINNNTGGVVELDPELSWNYEIGTRAELQPGLSVDATLFRMDYENQVVPASVAGGVGATLTNGGETLHQGAEFGARLDTNRLLGTTHNIYTRVALTFLPVARFEGTRYSSVSGFTTTSIAGNRLPYAPEQLATIGVGYAFAETLDVVMEASHVGEQYGDDLNTVTPSADGQRGLIPAHTIWNLAASYAMPRYGATIFVTVKNVFDELYIADRSRGVLPGTPRLVQAGVKVRF